MTLGQIRNAIDAMIQRGEFNPNLPASSLFPLGVPPTKTGKQPNPQEDITHERTT